LKKNICQLDDYVFLSDVKDLPHKGLPTLGIHWGMPVTSGQTTLQGLPVSIHDIEEVDKAMKSSLKPLCFSGLRPSALWETLMLVFMPLIT
jgi:hypothetical protein